MLTDLDKDYRDRRFGSRNRDFRDVIASRLVFEDFDDFAGDVAAVARAIERDGLIAPEHNVFAVA